MADLDDIFDDNWNDGNVTKPAIIRAEVKSLNLYDRAITVRLMRKEEDYMGIINRDKYSPQSHDGWIVRVVSNTQSDAEDIINETRRIVAQYNGTDDEDQFGLWELGDWETIVPFRWEFRFVVMIEKAGISI